MKNDEDNLPNYAALSNLIQSRMQSKHVNILIHTVSISIHISILIGVHGQSRNGPFGFAVLRLFVPSPAEALERQDMAEKQRVQRLVTLQVGFTGR